MALEFVEHLQYREDDGKPHGGESVGENFDGEVDQCSVLSWVNLSAYPARKR